MPSLRAPSCCFTAQILINISCRQNKVPGAAARVLTTTVVAAAEAGSRNVVYDWRDTIPT